MTLGPMRLAGLALAGGRSRRFGSEKAMALLAGRPLLAWSLAALGACCEATAVSAVAGGGAEALARAAGVTVLHDNPAHPEGPLAGIAAGLAWAAAWGARALVTLPCDTPSVGAGDLRALVAALGESDAAFALTAAGPQGLCAVWRVSIGPPLTAKLNAGDHPAVHRFLADIGAVSVRFKAGAAFGNVNTPTDLAALERAGDGI